MRHKALYPGILVLAVLALSSLLLVGPRLRTRAQDATPCCTEVAPRELDFPYYALNNGFDSTLLLVSDSPDPLDFILAIRNLAGQAVLSFEYPQRDTPGTAAKAILAPMGTKEFDGESGTSVAQATLASFQIPAHSTVDFSLFAELGQLPLPLPYASVRIQYSGAPGSVIAQVSSVDETQDLVVDGKTMNEGDGWAGSGANPWHVDSQTDSILFLTDESDQPARIGFHVVANGVTYYLTSLKLNPHETRAINIRKLRDAQKADFLKNRIPADASDGSVEWNRIDNVAVTGRVVVIQKSQGAASAYDCCMCPCPESYYGLSATPSPSSYLIPGVVVLVIATGAYRACNHGPTDYVDVSWEASYVSLSPSVAYINPNDYGEVVGASAGTSTISVSWSDYIYTYNGVSCNGRLTPYLVYATVNVCDFTIQGAPSGTVCDGTTKNHTTYQATAIPSACTVVPNSSSLTFVVGGDVTADVPDSSQDFSGPPTMQTYYWAGSQGGTITPEFSIQFDEVNGARYHQKTDNVCK